MFKLQTLGLMLAGTLTGAAVLGAGALIALDFTGADGLTHAWSAVTAARAAEPAPAPSAAPDPISARLQGVGEIDLFSIADVPGSPLIKVQTGTAYANARDLVAGTVSKRWCYAGREVPNSSFQPTITLGSQKGTQTPVLVQVENLKADETRQLGLTPEALVDLSRRLCRFGG